MPATLHRHLNTQYRLDAGILAGLVKLDGAVEVAQVGERQGLQALLLGAPDQVGDLGQGL